MTPVHRYFAVIFVFISIQVILATEEETLAKDKKFKLHSGDLMPLVGFGTWKVTGTDLVKEALDYALGAGYRMIDTATAYKNEEDIGKALKELLPKYNLTRQDIFITTKLAREEQGDKAYIALENSLKKLDCQYIDLYLIHWPGILGDNSTHEENFQRRDKSWQHLVKGLKNGLTRNIGVSNYNVRYLKELFENNHGVNPAVNQVEWHPYYHQDNILEFCRNESILLEAYSSLGGTDHSDLRDNTEVKKIANKLGKTSPQVLLRWALQQNIAIIPKARSKKHIEENINLDFVITDEDMKILSNLKSKKYGWDQDEIP